MFKRLIYDNWTSVVPIVSFCLTFGVFLLITLWALLLKKDFVHHMGALPLEDEKSGDTTATSHE